MPEVEVYKLSACQVHGYLFFAARIGGGALGIGNFLCVRAKRRWCLFVGAYCLCLLLVGLPVLMGRWRWPAPVYVL